MHEEVIIKGIWKWGGGVWNFEIEATIFLELTFSQIFDSKFWKYYFIKINVKILKI